MERPRDAADARKRYAGPPPEFGSIPRQHECRARPRARVRDPLFAKSRASRPAPSCSLRVRRLRRCPDGLGWICDSAGADAELLGASVAGGW
jgi:hypothetical protein